MLPTLVGLTVLIGGTVALAAPAVAAPSPTPVEIGAPTVAHAFDGRTGSSSTYSSDVALQKFVAAKSGHLTTITATFGGPTGGSPVDLYSDDEVSFGPAPGLANVVADLYAASTPLSSAMLAASGGGTQSATFTTAASIVAGETYWVLIHHAGNISGSFPTGATGYWAPSTTFTLVNANFAIDIDTDVPYDPIGVTLDPPSATGDHGWYTGDVTATYTCVSNVDACPSATTVTGDGATRLDGTVTMDSGATSFAWFHTVKIDRTPPTITGTAKATVNGVKVTWTCTDAASGVQSCPAPTYVSGVGTDTVATADATDVAGNTATGSVSGLHAGAHAPSITIHGVVPNKTYAYGTKVTPTCTAATTLAPAARKTTIHAATVTCTGTSSKKPAAKGATTWTYKATAVDTHDLGGTATKSVSWTVAAKAKATPKPAVATFVVHGLPKTTKHGRPVIDHRKSYDLSFVFKDKNGKVIKGKPTWLHSVKTNQAGTKGKPTKKLNAFTKVKGVWTMNFTPGYDYAGHYRKFGVIAPNGKRYYVVIYVK